VGREASRKRSGASATSFAASANARLPRAASAIWSWRNCGIWTEVGYVRFASVYRSFQDIEAFRVEIDQLRRTGGVASPAKDQLPFAAGR